MTVAAKEEKMPLPSCSVPIVMIHLLHPAKVLNLFVQGKPRPQYCDKPGWNFTRYNPSIRYQNQFCKASIEQCLNHLSMVPNFGSEAIIKIDVRFRFPSPKTGLIKNTADINNLCKFILDACNGSFYGDDGQVVQLSANKGYNDAYGREGYTRVTISKVSDR